MNNLNKLKIASLIILFSLCSCTQADVDRFNSRISTKFSQPPINSNDNRNSDSDKKNNKVNLPISGILPQFDDKIPFKNQYPRVAVTVIKSPPNHDKVIVGSNTIINSNIPTKYLLQARIWKDYNTYTDTEQFEFDIHKDCPYGIPMRDYTRFQTSTFSIIFDPKDHTGMKRTKGPLPPSKPFPDDRKHMAFFKAAISPTEKDSPDSLLMASLAYYSGMEPRAKDRRFWIVEFLDAQ